MVEIEKFEWTEDLSVDLREIDELQKKMFALFNALLDLKERDAEAKECANMISEINEYAKYYFSREEEILKENKYPELELHSGEHKNFTKHTVSMRRVVAEDKDNLTYENITELRDWLVDHIKEHDLLYVPFLRINRFIEETAGQN
ncbi:MAG: bacteriohemerythrin [Desulfobacteraceae bacterium]